jgi:hypothetical protein
MESGSTSGVRSRISARMRCDLAAYFALSGLMMTASGQSFVALNMGMAERTPESRAMSQAVVTTPRLPPPTMRGLAASSGRSRFSTLAQKASQSTWAIASVRSSG